MSDSKYRKPLAVRNTTTTPDGRVIIVETQGIKQTKIAEYANVTEYEAAMKKKEGNGGGSENKG